MSESAWNRGGLGAGYFDDEQPIPISDIPAPRRERGGFYQGRWSERGCGPRYYAGAFIGHEYSWKRRVQGPKHPRGVPGAGPSAGRGPRGYQRSDDRVRGDVCELLTEHGDVNASEVDVRFFATRFLAVRRFLRCALRDAYEHAVWQRRSRRCRYW